MADSRETRAGPTRFPAKREETACEEAAAKWFAQRDAGLTAQEEEAFQRWIAADQRHETAFARLDAAWSTFGKPVRAGAADELLEELASRARRRRRGVGIAALAAIAVVASGIVWQRSHPAESRSRAPTAVVLVPAQQVLPDGTRVTLNPDAQIAVAFTESLRRVELKRGVAHFDVAKQPGRPFVVGVKGAEVRAVGTAFSVQLGDSEVEVLVAEGTVEVSRPKAQRGEPNAERGRTGASVERSEIVDAGKRVVLEIAAITTPPRVTPLDATELDGRLAWRNPRVEFSGAPLADAVALLNRESAGRAKARLVIADKALESMRVSGIFRTDNLDAFVLLLEEGFSVTAERTSETITLRRATTRAN